MAATSKDRETGATKTKPVEIVAIPYYAWDNREPGEFVVWLPEDPARAAVPTLSSRSRPSASHVNPTDSVAALNDGIEPKSSSDGDILRFTWWDHRGTEEWVQYEFRRPSQVSAVEVYWFDDTGRGLCRPPMSRKVLYRADGAWKPVEAPSLGSPVIGRFDRIEFRPVETDAIRIAVQLQPGFSAGILEWRVE